MPKRIWRILAPYAAAVTGLALMLAAAKLLLHTNFPRNAYALMFLVVIMASAWWGGYGPGICVTVLTLTVAPYAVVPGFSIARTNVTQLGFLVLLSILISRVAETRNDREAALRDANQRLDERVRQRTVELERANAALHEREALLMKQADDLVRSNADLQQFAFLASHDLQEPLRMIAIYSELLHRRYAGQLDVEADRFIQVVTGSVRRMETLIRDLLTYSRVIHAQEPSQREPIDLAEPLQLAVNNLQFAVDEARASIEWDRLPRVPADRLQLAQVFQNLLSNALKYRGDDAPRIHISAERDHNDCIVTVRDNGLGIHPDYQDVIFQPFKRLHGQDYSGSGIGLAICRRLIERQGGRIWVESEPGNGAAFRFTLPLAAIESRAAAAVAAEQF